MIQRAKVSPIIFVASILSFLLPFFTVSCGGQKIASFSGVQLAVGTTIEQPQMFGPAQKKHINPDPSTAVAALCAVAGLVLSVSGARLAIGPAISGAMGAIALLVAKSRMTDAMLAQGQGMLQGSCEAGFFLALTLLTAGAAWNFYLWSQRWRVAAADAVSPSQFFREQDVLAGKAPAQRTKQTPPLDSQTDRDEQPASHLVLAAVVCSQCGSANAADAKFCAECGKPIVSFGAVPNSIR